MEHPQIPNNVLLRKARTENNLSVEDVAGMVGVSSRQVASWEAGTQPVPIERLQLLKMKIDRTGPPGSIVTVLAPDGLNFIDVISERNFAGMKLYGDGTAVIKSVAVERNTGALRMHTTRFQVDGNEHVANAGLRWQRNLEIGLRPVFEGDPDPVALSMATWLENRVREREQQDPEIRRLKDRMAAAIEARDTTWSPDLRERSQLEFDQAMADLNKRLKLG